MSVLPMPYTISVDGDVRAEPLLAELLAGHARFPSLFDANAEPRVLFDLAGELVSANAAALKLLGRRLSVVRGSRFGRGCSRHMGGHESEAFALAIAGRTARVATTIAGDGGTLHALEVSLFPAIVDGTTVGVYACALDVTSRMDRERGIDRRIQELSSLFLHHADSTISVDEFGRIRSVNAAFERLLGFTAAELIGRAYTSLLFEASADTSDVFKHALSGNTTTGMTRLKHKTGERIDLVGAVVPIVVDDRVVGVYAVCHDNEQERSETARMRELYLLAADASNGAEAQLATALNIGRRRLGCKEAYVARVEDAELVYVHCAGATKRREGARRSLHDTLDNRALVAGEAIATTGTQDVVSAIAPIVVGVKNFGTIAFVEPRAGSFTAEDLDYVRLISSLASAAIDRGEQHRRLDALAFYDVLTGLPNRAFLAEKLDDTIAQAERDDRSFALHFLDLDGFKLINDAHGHARGDEVIALVGKRLERHVGKRATVARVGGDEFVIVQPNVDGSQDARTLAESIRAAIAEPIVVDDGEYRITASVGIAFYPSNGRLAATLLAHADSALYKVKACGRNGLAFA